jgi:hypothetical protein
MDYNLQGMNFINASAVQFRIRNHSGLALVFTDRRTASLFFSDYLRRRIRTGKVWGRGATIRFLTSIAVWHFNDVS